MSDFKEFLGKTLDAAIADACAYYDTPREKLEIDIIEDAKSGIFGLVGARKARIRARRAQLPDMRVHTKSNDLTPEAEDTPVQEASPRSAKRTGKGRHAPASTTPTAGAEEELHVHSQAFEHGHATAGASASTAQAPAGETVPAEAGDFPAEDNQNESADQLSHEGRRGRNGRNAPRSPKAQAVHSEGETATEAANDGDIQEISAPRVALSELDQEQLRTVVANMVSGLIFPLVGEVPLEISINDDRVQVKVECEDTGLLIGREGQNLASVQYLAARMVTRAMGAQVRVQVDAGDYHSRQDSRLQEMALALAEKVHLTGKSQSTRPLSAYQRRVIHLALQDDPYVQTRSSGEGPLKRVVILRRKD